MIKVLFCCKSSENAVDKLLFKLLPELDQTAFVIKFNQSFHEEGFMKRTFAFNFSIFFFNK